MRVGRIDGGLGEVAVRSARHPVPALVFLLILTGLGSYGLSLTSFEGDILDILPEDSEHTRNAREVQETFPFFFDQVGIYLTIDEGRWEAANENLPDRQTPEMPESGLDEVYIRGVDEFVGYMRQEIPALAYDVDIAGILKLLNWANTGVPGPPGEDPLVPPDPDAYAMPGTDPEGSARFLGAWLGVQQYPEVEEVYSPDDRTTEVVLVFDPDSAGVSHNDVGAQVIDALEGYPAWAESEGRFQAFQLETVAADGLPVVDAHAAAVTFEDMVWMAPLAFALVVGLLWWAFRSGKVLVATGSTLVVAFVWATGLLGLLGIPLANLNLAYAPVILGVGLDYAIHMVNGVVGRVRRGVDEETAFREAGEQVGTATSLATLTTVGGLLVLLWSPTPMMAQVALAGAVAVATVYVLTFTWLPASLGLLGLRATGHEPPRSRVVPLVARLVQRNRPLFAGLLVVGLVASAAAVPNVTRAAFGDPELQFPEGDKVREWHETVDAEFFLGEPTGNAFFVVRGDIQTPDAHDYMIRLGEAWNQSEIGGQRIAHLPRLIDSWNTVKDGTANALMHTVLTQFPQSPATGPYYDYPRSGQEIRDTLDDIFASPFANFTSFFVQPPEYGITVVTAEVEHGDTYEEAKRVWDGMEAIRDSVDRGGRPDDVSVTFFGNAPFSRLFIEEQVPWVNTLLGVVTGLVVVAVAAVTRSLRAALAVALVSLGGSVVWAAFLYLAGIAMSPLLFLPIIILIAVGTDDAIHLVMGVRRDGAAAYGTVGRAIVFTSLTSIAAFGVFTQIRHLGVRESMMATAAAVGVSFLLTVLLVPLLQRTGEGRGEDGRDGDGRSGSGCDPDRPPATRGTSDAGSAAGRSDQVSR